VILALWDHGHGWSLSSPTMGGTYVVYTREPDYDCDEGLVRDSDTESVSVCVPSWRYNDTLPWLVAVERCTSGTCNGRAVSHEGVVMVEG
jgi:hypothetical protein